MTKKELCVNVAKRILKVNPGADQEEAEKRAKRAVKILKKIQDLPRYSSVINMTHQELNLTLQECPESPYFFKDNFETNEAQARRLVLAFVERARFGGHFPVRESTKSEE